MGTLISKGLSATWDIPITSSFHHQYAMDYRQEPWILIQWLVENMSSIKTIFNNITVSFLGLKDHPRRPTWTCAISNPYMAHIWVCHIKTISNPYMAHIWVTPIPKIGLWTFLRGLTSPWAHDPFFHTRQRFLLPNHVTSGCLSPRSLFSGQRFWAHHPLSNHRSAVALPVSNGENQSEASISAHTGPLYYSSSALPFQALFPCRRVAFPNICALY